MFWIFAIAMLGMGIVNNDNRNYSTTNINNVYKTSKIEIPKGIFGALPSKGDEVKNKVEEIKKERDEVQADAVKTASSVIDAK